jgi:hypothetical protein
MANPRHLSPLAGRRITREGKRRAQGSAADYRAVRADMPATANNPAQTYEFNTLIGLELASSVSYK